MSHGSCIYSGWVMHRRHKPRRHHFRYRAWWLLIDIDEVEQLSAKLRSLSHGRFNLFAFHERDHGHDARPLRMQIDHQLSEAGISLEGGAIRLLCMPRVLGYAFNPISVYFCHHRDGYIAATIYEVHNTFGERHSYVIAAATGSGHVIRQQSGKRLYVSPFMDMNMRYDFRVTEPGDTISLAISGSDDTGPLLHAVLQASRRELSDAQLLRLLVTHPLVTLKVLGGIHWEALRLWRKRLRLYPRPSPPSSPVTVVPTQDQTKSSHA